MNLQATVIGLTRFPAKGAVGEALQKTMLLEGLGMEGDFYAQGGERQLSFLSLEDRQEMDAQKEKGLCFARYKENLLFDKLPVSLIPGTKLTLGGAVLEISSERKHCFEECPLFSRGKSCILAGRCLFAKVISSGIVRIGDRIELFDFNVRLTNLTL